MAELLTPEFSSTLVEHLKTAFFTEVALSDWLALHYPRARTATVRSPLDSALTDLMIWSGADDGLRHLLQTLANHPPAPQIAMLVSILTGKQIIPQDEDNQGLPQVPPEQSCFVADRPFVNRSVLRQHLSQLDKSQGASSVLIIDGPERAGKTFAISLALRFPGASGTVPLDINDYAGQAALLNAYDMVMDIADVDPDDGPEYDDTKEEEAVPHLLRWLMKQLKGKKRWIIIDHCNRRGLTSGAQRIIVGLTEKLHAGVLPDVRLILVDFDRAKLPPTLQNSVRYDTAELPDQQRVADWCVQLAAMAKRQCPPEAPVQWASDVFSNLAAYSKTDSKWHLELEAQLRKTYDRIKACEQLS